MSKNIILLSMIALAGNAFSAGWGVQTTITGYYVYDTGGAYINVAQKENPDNCASNTYLYLDTTATNFKSIYATVMTAQASQQTVTLRYNGCSGNYPRIDAVAVPGRW